jgi:DNA-binding transcriptional LysR family regulator
MTLVQLRHLIELANAGSFSLAATRLFLTQPALSRSIASLQDELGQPLFDRVGRKIELTAFGSQTVQRARELVEAAQALQKSAKQASQGATGQVRLGLGSGAGAMLMTPLLLHMAQHHPQAQIHLARGNTDLLVRALRERELDVLVIDLRSLKPASDLAVVQVGELPGAFMCRKGHALSKKKQVTLEMVRQYPVASTPLSDEVARVLIDRYGPEAHPEQLITLRCEEISSLLDVARTSDTVVVAVRAVAPDLQELRMHPPLNATARFGWVTLKNRSVPPLCASLQTLVRQWLASN